MLEEERGCSGGSPAHREHVGHVGETDGGLNRRISCRRCRRRWPRRRRFRARRLNSFCGLTLSRTVITPVCLSWLEEASIAGGNGYWRSQGFGLGENWAGGGRTRARVSSWGIYKLQRRASSRIGVRRGRQRGREEEHGVEVASSARRGWGRPPPVVLFSEGVSWATVWWWSGPSVGLLLGSGAGLRWPGELLSIFPLFAFFYFLFSILFYNPSFNFKFKSYVTMQVSNFEFQ
jgi:hypothetical protein